MHNKNRNTSKRKNSKRRANRKRKGNSKIVILREPGAFVPDVFQVVLVYNDTSVARLPGSSTNAANWRYRSSAFDPDPLLLTGSIPGFVEMANMYRHYLVVKMEMIADIGNQQTEAMAVHVWPSLNNNNNNSLSADDIRQYSSNMKGKSKILGSTVGTSVARIRTTASLARMVPQYGYSDLDFGADTSTNPIENYYINIGIVKYSGNISFDIPSFVTIRYHIRFSQRRQLES